ncbi:MAG: sugar kinase [Candidatus Lokiarchaeota archaeon]|nr:sugar kinase [Candidatus Lokiarchaeota archaeon]
MVQTEKKAVVTLGEIMVRLKSPGNERLFQSPALEATFGGGEANVAISLAHLGIEARFVTALPKNAIGDAAIAFLRSMNIDTSKVARQGRRVGTYYLEAGAGPRPSSVTYDREHSSISEAKPEDFDWDAVFAGARWFHVTGITPALSASCAALSVAAAGAAKERGLTVSCDLNYRKNLWKYGKKAPEVMVQLMPHVDVVVANEEDVQNSLGMQLDQKIGGVELSAKKYEALARQVLDAHSNVELVAITLRESYSADHNDLSAMCSSRKEGKARLSRKYQLTDIVDRVGGGDAFAAGLIYALYKKMDMQDALEFAVAASALKHTIPGDCNRVSVDEVTRLLAGDSSGRVQR